MLALSYAGGHYTLDNDVCDVQVGCMLFKEQPDKNKKPVGYWARSHKKAEKAYDRTQ